MKIKTDLPTEDVQVNIVPLIDVIFCILTFFILAAVGLTRQQAISVDIPQARTGVSQMREMLIVSVDPVGQTYVEKELMPSRVQLRQKLQAYRAANPVGLMVLYASKQALYEDVIGVLDVMRDVGGDRVALATLPGSSQPSGTSPLPGIPGLTPLPNNVPINPLDPSTLPNPTNPFPANPAPTLPPAPGDGNSGQ